MIPLEDDVRSELRPFHPVIVAAVLAAWADWLASTEYGRTRYERTRACVVWERVIAHVRVGFLAVGGVTEVPGHETTRFLCGSVLLRFKKADASGMSSSYPTQFALSYHNHQNSMFGEVARVEVVYILDALKTKIIDIRVVARSGSLVAWAYSIMPTAEVIAARPAKAPVESPADELVSAKTDENKSPKSG